MEVETLALYGGPISVDRTLEPFPGIGDEELEAANRVIRSGVLSGYLGAAGKGFMGGPEVQAFESKICDYFGVTHAIAVNSWTSGLVASVGAIGIEPGDEIITSPWTMAATATAMRALPGRKSSAPPPRILRTASLCPLTKRPWRWPSPSCTKSR